jgi:TRAP-type mannitol/chloroaromatic compound transport system substrate-binding protein
MREALDRRPLWSHGRAQTAPARVTKEEQMRQRTWLTLAVVVVAVVVVLASLAAAPAQPKTFVWKVQSSFPITDYPHRSLIEVAKSIEQMSGGRLKIEPLPVGAVVGFFEVLDAVNRGALDGGMTWPGLWVGKNSAAGLFGSPLGGPFGMGQNEFTAWLFVGGGQELYNELLQKELKMDVVAHFTTIQPFWEAFGWLKRPVTNLEELRKLKFRSSGIGLEMFKRMGISTVGMAGGDIVPSLERGVIDGAEWAIPSRDAVMGFQQAAKHYYMPSFRQPPTYHELIVNRKKWAELPPDLQAIVKHATLAEITRLAAYTVDQDAKAAEELVAKGVQIHRTPDEVLRAELDAIEKTFDAEAQKNPFFAKVLAAQREYAKKVVPHAQRMTPPMEIAVRHFWQKK